MKLNYKLRKLFQGEGLRSAAEHLRRWTHPIDWKAMYRKLDPVKLALIQERYLNAGRTEDVGNSAKFADAKYWLKVNVERAQDLDLDRSGPLRVLDIGCGAGYFLHVCQCLGHEAVGLDIDENPLYRDTMSLLGTRRIIARIDAGTPLPTFEEKFDLVTAHCICFQKFSAWKDGTGPEWGEGEWRFFLEDVRSRLLAEHGRILLDFNPRGGGHHYPKEVEKLFREAGARFFRSKVLIDHSSPKKTVRKVYQN